MELAIPTDRLCVRERESVAELALEVEGVRTERGREEEQRQQSPGLPPGARPQQVDERGKEREPHGSRRNRQSPGDSREPRSSTLRGEERGRGEHEEQAVRVERGEDESGREEREDENGVACALDAELLPCDRGHAPRAEPGGDEREQRAPDERGAEDGEERRIEREERSRRLVVAVPRDPQEPARVPLVERSEHEIGERIPGAIGDARVTRRVASTAARRPCREGMRLGSRRRSRTGDLASRRRS